MEKGDWGPTWCSSTGLSWGGWRSLLSWSEQQLLKRIKQTQMCLSFQPDNLWKAPSCKSQCYPSLSDTRGLSRSWSWAGAYSGHRTAKFSRQLGQCLGELGLFWKQLRQRLIFNLILSQENMLSLRRRRDRLQLSVCILRGPGDLTSSHGEGSALKRSMNLAFGVFLLSPVLSRRWSLFSICLEWTLLEAGRQSGKSMEQSRDKG